MLKYFNLIKFNTEYILTTFRILDTQWRSNQAKSPPHMLYIPHTINTLYFLSLLKPFDFKYDSELHKIFLFED